MGLVGPWLEFFFLGEQLYLARCEGNELSGSRKYPEHKFKVRLSVVTRQRR